MADLAAGGRVMKILDRYLMGTLLRFTLMVLVIVAAVDAFIYLIGEFGSIGQGDYGIGHAFVYVLSVLPGQLYGLFPMIGLLGALIGLGLLAQNSELVVMRAAGMQLTRMMRMVFRLAIVLIVVVTCIGELFAPRLTAYAEQMKLMATSGGQAAKTRYGLWLKDAERFIFVGAVLPNGHVRNVTVYSFPPDQTLKKALHAKQAVKIADDEWRLQDVTESQLQGETVRSQSVPNKDVTLRMSTKSANDAGGFASQLSLLELYQDIRQQIAVGMSPAQFELAFWQRLVQPFSSLVMILLAVPFIFGPLRSVTMGLRIVTGAAVGLAFYLLNQFFGPFCLVYQVPAFLGAALPTVLFAFLGLMLMRRVK